MFVLFPFALAAVGIVVFPLPAGPAAAAAAADGRVMLAAFALTMLPWFTYNYVTLGRFTLSPAGGIGRGMWEGSWQATLVRPPAERADASRRRHRRSRRLDRRVDARSPRANSLPAGPMLEYVHQWQDIRRIWTAADRSVRARAWRASTPTANTCASALENIRARFAGASRQASRARRVHPVGRRDSDSLQRHQPAAAGRHSRLLGGAGARSSLAALGGIVTLLARRPRRRSAVCSRAPILYITGRALSAADRSASVAAGAAGRAAARGDRRRAARRPSTSPQTAGS